MPPQGALVVDVTGLPAPQGSKRGFVVNGHVVMTESSKKVKPWRQDVVAAAESAITEAGWLTASGPVEVEINFWMPRPRYHFRTGARAHLLRDNAPSFVDKKPDIDKLARATLDALTTSAVLRDDAQVARLVLTKTYAVGAIGARIVVQLLDPQSTVSAPGGEAGAGTVQDQQGVLL